jgi:hypothetical protein
VAAELPVTLFSASSWAAVPWAGMFAGRACGPAGGAVPLEDDDEPDELAASAIAPPPTAAATTAAPVTSMDLSFGMSLLWGVELRSRRRCWGSGLRQLEEPPKRDVRVGRRPRLKFVW